MIEIPLTQGQVALVDDEDFELVSQYKWCAGWDPTSHSFYAQARAPTQNGKQVTIRMHRLIMNAKPGEQVDHIHHKTLDNRKSELRVCSRNQNQHNSFRHTDNSSGYKGVCLNKKNRKMVRPDLCEFPENTSWALLRSRIRPRCLLCCIN